MTRNRRFLLIIALVVVVVAVAGVTVARAFGGADLPTMTPAQLLAKVAEQAPKTTALSGEYAFTNNILGTDTGPLGSLAGLSVPFLAPQGSGKVAVADGKANVTLVGGASTMQVVHNGTTLWVYSSSTNTATEYTLPAHTSTDASANTTTTTAVPTDPTTAIEHFLAKLAPNATVAITGQQEVAGQAAYTLVLTPTAPNTVLGSVTAAIDGKTFVPLSIQVSAKGNATPVLSLVFTKITYAAPAASAFDFTPPAGATVNKQDLSLKLPAAGGSLPFGSGSDSATGTAGTEKPAPLTLAQAEAKAGFHVLSPTTADPAHPFGGAYVVNIPADLASKMAAGAGSSSTTSGTGTSTSSPDTTGLPAGLQGLGQGLSTFAQGFVGELKGPIVVQQYGKGFGTVMLAQAALNSTTGSSSLFGGTGGTNPLTMLPLFKSTSVNGHQALEMITPLGGFVMWQQDGSLQVAAGMVSQADLANFAAGLQ